MQASQTRLAMSEKATCWWTGRMAADVTLAPDTSLAATPVSRRGRTLAPLGPVAQLRAGRLPRRLAQLAVGLVLYGVTLAMIIRSTLGNASWDVLHQGMAQR